MCHESEDACALRKLERTTEMRKQLFGGALLAAGLFSAAGAQEFIITGRTPLYTSIIGLPPSGLNWLYIDVNDLYDASLVSAEGSYARSMAGPTVISDIVLNQHKGPDRVAYGIHVFPIKFQVTEQATVFAETGQTHVHSQLRVAICVPRVDANVDQDLGEPPQPVTRGQLDPHVPIH